MVIMIMVFVSWRLCVNIYAWQAIDVNITHLLELVLKAFKEDSNCKFQWTNSNSTYHISKI